LAERLLSGRACVRTQVGVTRLTGKAICPICQKRRAERYCPAKGEKICAIDCGTEREVTIDCPRDCPYLLTAHRWESEHPKSLPGNELPFPDVRVSSELIHTRQAALSGIGYTVLVYAREQPALSDSDVLAATQAMAETRRTLLSGIYYEKPPASSLAAGLYSAFSKFIEDEKKRAAEQPEISAIKDSELFLLLVFFLRFGRLRSNGRTRTRGFIDFLRAQYPAEMGLTKEEPRIIVP